MGKGQKQTLTYSTGRGNNSTICPYCSKPISGRTLAFVERLMAIHLSKTHGVEKFSCSVDYSNIGTSARLSKYKPNGNNIN